MPEPHAGVTIGLQFEPHPWRRVRLTMAAAAVLLPLIGGATVLIAAGGGLYWIAAAVIWAIIVAVANAWVLLVEILRYRRRSCLGRGRRWQRGHT